MKTSICDRKKISFLAIIGLFLAPAHTTTFVVGDIDSLPLLSINPPENGSFILTNQPGGTEFLLEELNIGTTQQAQSNIYLANATYDDLTINLIVSSVKSQKNEEIGPLSPAHFHVHEVMNKSFQVLEDGKYEFWFRTGDDIDKDFYTFEIDNALFYFPKSDRTGRWIKIGPKHLKKGAHTIKVIFRSKEATNQKRKFLNKDNLRNKTKNKKTEIVIVSVDQFLQYQNLLRGQNSAIAFQNSGLENILKKPFQIIDSGNYQITSLFRYRGINIPIGLTSPPFHEKNELWSKLQGGKTGVKTPSLFAEGFYESDFLYFPLQNGLWRWMSNQGKILIINPTNQVLKISLSGEMVSTFLDREVEWKVKNQKSHFFNLDGPKNRISEITLSRINNFRELSFICGPIKEFRIPDISLFPGINEIDVLPRPGATIFNNTSPVSIAINEYLKIEHSPTLDYSEKPATNPLQIKWKKNNLILSGYFGPNNNLGWAHVPFPQLDLRSYPLFLIQYSWPNPQQAMDIGFTIDTGIPNTPPLFITKTLPATIKNQNEMEINLLEIAWNNINQASKPKLIGLDFYPRSRWGLESRFEENTFLEYQIKRVGFRSTENSIVTSGKENLLLSTVLSDPSGFSIEKNDNFITLTPTLQHIKMEFGALRVQVPLRNYNPESPSLILNYSLENPKYQEVKLFIGFDKNNDSKVDLYKPLGETVRLSEWTLINDMSSPILTYETNAPENLDHCSSWSLPDCNPIVEKNKEFYSFGSEENFFSIRDSKIFMGHFSLKSGKIRVSMPRNQHPDQDDYALYFPTPEQKSRLGQKSRGVLVDLNTLKNGEETPVELFFLLKQKISDESKNPTAYSFTIQTPEYFKVLDTENFSPFILDQPKIFINGRTFDHLTVSSQKKNGGVVFSGNVHLEKGLHHIKIRNNHSLEHVLTEIRPISKKENGAKRSPVNVAFERINPTKFIAKFQNPNRPFVLTFDQNYNSRWNAKIIRPIEAGQILTTHMKINGYANAWKIPLLPAGTNEIEVIIEYSAQKWNTLFVTAMIIFWVIAIILFVILGWKHNEN